MAAAQRTSQEIRRSIELARTDLTNSVTDLQVKVRQISDWRRHLRDNRQTALVGAAAAGFLIGGGIAGVAGLLRRRRGRRTGGRRAARSLRTRL
jgi:hypothetical protein